MTRDIGKGQWHCLSSKWRIGHHRTNEIFEKKQNINLFSNLTSKPNFLNSKASTLSSITYPNKTLDNCINIKQLYHTKQPKRGNISKLSNRNGDQESHKQDNGDLAASSKTREWRENIPHLFLLSLRSTSQEIQLSETVQENFSGIPWNSPLFSPGMCWISKNQITYVLGTNHHLHPLIFVSCLVRLDCPLLIMYRIIYFNLALYL